MEFRIAVSAPQLTARLGRDAVASPVARLIASGIATTKADLCRATGLTRTTVDAGVETLLRLAAVRVSGVRPPQGRGRPAEVLELRPEFGVVLTADCGPTASRLAVFDLSQRSLAASRLDVSIDVGPEVFLDRLTTQFEALLANARVERVPRTVVLGLPGPVDRRAGAVVRPPIMPGWDGFDVVSHLGASLDASVVLENDVNLRALGEARVAPVASGPLLYVMVGAGIGAGIVGADGALWEGADGAAGDIGHIRVPGSAAECSCGAVGCLEAEASVAAIGRDLGVSVDEVFGLVARHDRTAIAMVRERSRALGDVVVSLIHCFNPARVVVGGRLGLASDDVLAGVRSAVYERALPLATRNLAITLPTLGDESGTAGALALGIERALDPESIARRMRAGSARTATPRPGG